jgi:hypothetical protein
LLDDSRYRPPEEPFAREALPRIFGEVYDALIGLPVGASIDLSSLATIRREYAPAMDGTAGAFRYIRIGRGAAFPGSPASNTARQFSFMREEVPPWMVTLVSA